MSLHNENRHVDEKPAVSVDEKLDHSLDQSSNPDALNDGEKWRHGIDPVHEKRVLRKLDLHLLPFVSLLYLLSFLDRSNIGNAKVAGLVTDLNLVGLQYNVAAAVFFILYCAAEIPSNIALKLLRPSRWIPSIMVAWGIVMTLMSLVKSYEDLVIARIFLGLTEGGLFPGVTYYLSMWYKRSEQSRRVAIFFSAATVAGAFGGLLAYGIEKLEGTAGLHGWAWIFLIEGLMTIVVAFTAYWFMYDYPSTAKFLTTEEREFVVERLKRDSTDLATHYDKKFVYQALTDWKCWLQVVVYTGVLIPVYAFSLFIPTIIAELGYASTTAQLLSTPPYIAACFFTVSIGIVSDNLKLRGPFVVFCASVAIAGYAILYATPAGHPGVAYAGSIIAACGVFPSIPVVLAWAGGSAGGDVKRGVALAMAIGVANLGGVCSSFIYRTQDAPAFHIGHGTVIGSLLLSIVASCIAMYTYTRLNKQKEEQCRLEGINHSHAAQFREMGDDSPLFRFDGFYTLPCKLEENHHHWWQTEKRITMAEIDRNTSQNITELSVFDFLPSWVKMRLDPFPPGHKDWKACSSCGIYDRNSKLMACSRCRNSRLGPIYYCGKRCQRRQWEFHKQVCEIYAQDPRDPKGQARPAILKLLENWLFINSAVLIWALKQAFYHNPDIDLETVYVHIMLASDDQPQRIPPRLWPVRISFVPRGFLSRKYGVLEHSDAKGELCYSLLDYTHPATKERRTELFSERLSSTWRQDMAEMPFENYSDWASLFLTSCLAGSMARDSSAHRTTLLLFLAKAAHMKDPETFSNFNSEMKVDEGRSQVRSLDVSVDRRWVSALRAEESWAKESKTSTE